MATRKKIYYTTDETTNNLFTKGREWMTSDETEYVGSYHRYLTGEVFTESKWNPKISKPLISYRKKNIDSNIKLYKKLKPRVKTLYQTPNSFTPTISNNNINAGVLTRYFYKKYDVENILETDQKTYNQIQTNVADKKLYTTVTMNWKISGNKQEEYKNGAVVPGVISINTKQIKVAETIMPGISKLLSNPLQYYTDTDFITPTDINGLDS